MASPADKNPTSPQQTVRPGVGIALVLGILIVALCLPEPSGFQSGILTTVLALACAIVGARLTGDMEVHGKKLPFAVRATASMALFSMVFWGLPFIIDEARAKSLPTSQESPARIENGSGGKR